MYCDFRAFNVPFSINLMLQDVRILSSKASALIIICIAVLLKYGPQFETQTIR